MNKHTRIIKSVTQWKFVIPLLVVSILLWGNGLACLAVWDFSWIFILLGMGLAITAFILLIEVLARDAGGWSKITSIGQK